MRAIVVPAYNEVRSIGSVISEIQDKCDLIIVVDDCSSDSTALTVENMDKVKLIRRTSNKGYSNSIELGIKHALDSGADLILTIDADGQHPSEMIETIFLEIERLDADLIIACRPKFPRISERLISILMQMLYGVKDITSGMKCYRSKAISQLSIPNSFNSVGTYIALMLCANGSKISQLKIEVKNRAESKSRFGSGLNTEFKLALDVIRTVIKTRRDCGYQLRR